MKEAVSSSEKSALLKTLLWSARILFFLASTVIMFAEWGPGPANEPLIKDWLFAADLFFAWIGLGGLLFAYWKEGIGGMIALSGYILSSIFIIIDSQLSFYLFIFVIQMIPTSLYLAYWLKENGYLKD